MPHTSPACNTPLTATYTLDYAAGMRVLYEQGGAFSNTQYYLYGLTCLGELVNADDPNTKKWRYYHPDGQPLVRQTSDEQGHTTLAWGYSPAGATLYGEEGPVTNLDCGATYDWNTGLIYKNGNYFDPTLQIWLSFAPGIVWLAWKPRKHPSRKKNKKALQLFILLLLVVPALASCTPFPTPEIVVCPPASTPLPTLPPLPSLPPTILPTVPSTSTTLPTTTPYLPTPTPPPPTLTPLPPTSIPQPTLPPNIEWLEGSFLITHYHFVLETDPVFASDPRINIQGFPAERTFRQGFIWHPRALLDKGTGIAEDGTYITIDWVKSTYDPANPANNDWWFKEGIGANVEAWKTVATVHPRLPKGTMIIIESYKERGIFRVSDTGGGLPPDRIDVFVGAMTIADVDSIAVQYSRVGIVK